MHNSTPLAAVRCQPTFESSSYFYSFEAEIETIILVITGLVGGLVATIVMTVLMVVMGDDSPPPTAACSSRSRSSA